MAHRIGTFLGIALLLAGCAKSTQRTYDARLTGSAALEIRVLEDDTTVKSKVVKDRLLWSANAITAVQEQDGWVIVECHMNPSSGILVAWNLETDTVYVSPGYTWTLVGDTFTTIHRVHFVPPDSQVGIDREATFINGVEQIDSDS